MFLTTAHTPVEGAPALQSQHPRPNKLLFSIVSHRSPTLLINNKACGLYLRQIWLGKLADNLVRLSREEMLLQVSREGQSSNSLDWQTYTSLIFWIICLNLILHQVLKQTRRDSTRGGNRQLEDQFDSCAPLSTMQRGVEGKRKGVWSSYDTCVSLRMPL